MKNLNYLIMPRKEVEALMNKAHSDGYNSYGQDYCDLLAEYSEIGGMLYEEFMRGSNRKTTEQYENMPSWEQGYGMI